MKTVLYTALAAVAAFILGVVFVELTQSLFYNSTIGPVCAWCAYLAILTVVCTGYLAHLIRKHH